jgi:hypothetical protein
MVLALPVRAGMPRVVLMGRHATTVMILPASKTRRRWVRLAVVASRRDVDRAASNRSREKKHQQGAEHYRTKFAHFDSFLS